MHDEQNKSEETLRPKKEWTIMVYMAGDNNLSEDMVTGLKGMMKVAGQANINLVALYDSGYPPIPIKIYDFSDAKPSSSNPANPGELVDYAVHKNDVAQIPYTNSEFVGIKHFVPWVLKKPKFRAKRYALILSGHSDGIIGRSLLRDENPYIVLDLSKLRGVLEVAKYPLGDGEKFDLLGFDGCLMNMLEVGYELKDIARVMVGSEGNIPSSGWAYEEVLKDFKDNANIEADEFAVKIVDRYADFNKGYEIGGRSVNISACQLERVEPLANAINEFAKLLLRILNLPPVKPEDAIDDGLLNNVFLKQQLISLILLSHLRSQSFMHEQGVDILDFIRVLLSECAIKFREGIQIYGEEWGNKPVNQRFAEIVQSIYEVYEEIKKVIEGDPEKKYTDRYVLNSRDLGADYQYSNGVSIFFPWTEIALDLLYKKYKSLKFNKEKRAWLRFIDKFTNLTLRKPDTVIFPGLSELKATRLIFNQLTIEFYLDIVHRVHEVREHAGREHAGRGDLEAFYRYFGQVRNYSTEIKHEP